MRWLILVALFLAACADDAEPVPADQACAEQAEAFCGAYEPCAPREAGWAEACAETHERWCLQRHGDEPIDPAIVDECLAAIEEQTCEAFRLPVDCVWSAP